jgi:hypothetical protein
MLEDNSILQVDATVIAGILVLLTILYTLTPRKEEEGVVEILKARRTLAIVTLSIIVPFSISAIIVSGLFIEVNSQILYFARNIMGIGFIYLVFGLFVAIGSMPGPRI